MYLLWVKEKNLRPTWNSETTVDEKWQIKTLPATNESALVGYRQLTRVTTHRQHLRPTWNSVTTVGWRKMTTKNAPSKLRNYTRRLPGAYPQPTPSSTTSTDLKPRLTKKGNLKKCPQQTTRLHSSIDGSLPPAKPIFNTFDRPQTSTDEKVQIKNAPSKLRDCNCRLPAPHPSANPIVNTSVRPETLKPWLMKNDK